MSTFLSLDLIGYLEERLVFVEDKQPYYNRIMNELVTCSKDDQLSAHLKSLVQTRITKYSHLCTENMERQISDSDTDFESRYPGVIFRKTKLKTWDDVVLKRSTKHSLKSSTVIPLTCYKQNLPGKDEVLLYGVPGTGMK